MPITGHHGGVWKIWDCRPRILPLKELTTSAGLCKERKITMGSCSSHLNNISWRLRLCTVWVKVWFVGILSQLLDNWSWEISIPIKWWSAWSTIRTGIARRGLKEYDRWSIAPGFLAQRCVKRLTIRLGTGESDLQEMWKKALQNSPMPQDIFSLLFQKALPGTGQHIYYIYCMDLGAFMVLSFYRRTAHRGWWTLSLQHMKEQDK